MFQSQLKFTCVLLLPFLKFTGKTWLSWSAKVTQQQFIMLSSTFVSMWIGGWSTSVGMAPALGWCGVLAQSVTSNPHGYLGCVAALCCFPARVLSRWLWEASSSDSGWYSSEWDSTRPSALQKGERESSTVLQPVNKARDVNSHGPTSWAEVTAVGEICRNDLELVSTVNFWPGCGW